MIIYINVYLCQVDYCNMAILRQFMSNKNPDHLVGILSQIFLVEAYAASSAIGVSIAVGSTSPTSSEVTAPTGAC